MKSPTPLSLRRALCAAITSLLAGVGLIALGAAPPAAATPAGATLPFTSFEAEAGTLSGGATTVSLVSAPTTEFSSPPLEASGHAYAQLTGTGQSVKWTNTTGAPIRRAPPA